jgi:GT2 family glycosyltransferase
MRSKAQQQRAEWKDGAPDVTVIVPVHNQMIFTFACLCSILSLAGKVTFEIIVGDDCSTDGTSGLFRSIGGCVRLIRHESNLGFLNNCNACAKSAMGEYVVFLNNDAIVLPHWLDSLIDVFEHQDDVGLVGSKLLNVDGSLQEAGGIFWSDGSAWNFGRNQNPRKPAFNYVKDVDYCSGASIALRASKWHELGGFDPVFSPAYCEDSDLAFRVRAAGLRVVFTPFSEVIHHEGVSHGRDINTGVKAYQVRNTELFRQRWSEVLSSEHFPNGESVFLARDRSRDKKHVLVIDHYIPQFDRDAGSRTMFQYMRMFTDAGYQVVLWPDNLNEDRDYVTAYQNLGMEVIYGPDFVDGFSRWMTANGNSIDYVFATRPHVTEKYIDPIQAHSKAKIIYYGQDLHYARMLREQAMGLSGVGDPEIKAMKNLELNICRKSDFVLYPSEDECRVVGSEIQSPSKVIEFPIFFFSDETLDEAELRIAAAEPLTKAMMFVGGFNHRPNADGVLWFASEVWPLIRGHDPEFVFRIAGSNPPSEIMQLGGSGIEVLGRISDEKLTELYQTSFCTVAPLRYGAGVKGKVIEAFAAGTPVVTTTTGVQGIDSNVAFVTDDPKEMARLIIQASQDPAARAEKSKAALEFVRRCYSINAAAERLGRAMPELPGLVRASKVVHKPPQHGQPLAMTLGVESGEIDGRR